MPGEQPRRPQFVRIAKVLRLVAGQISEPGFGLDGDDRLAARPHTIIKRRHRPFGHRALDAALDRLMMQSERLPHCKKRGVFPIRQQYPRPLDPTRRFRPRLRDHSQFRRIRIIERQLNRAPPRGHLSKSFSPRSPSSIWESEKHR